jgi:DGQHR domain-containing protein
MSITIGPEEATMVAVRTPIPRAGDADLSVTAIPVVRGQNLRNGVPLVAGFMPAGALLPNNYEIPYHNPNTLKGYQRALQESRINELVSDMRRGLTDLPTAVLLNLRNRDARRALQDGVLNLTLPQDPLLGLAGAVRAALLKFYVVDGQHRILALLKLLTEYPEEEWGNFLVPFVCMLGATEEEEMEQFYIVNSKAKSVRTDLAQELLKQLAESNPTLLQALTERGKDWQVTAQQLVRELADLSPIWRDRIRFAGMDKGNTTMSSASMVTSLKPVLASPYFKVLQMSDQAKILDAFWRGLRDVMADAFDYPEDYALQKGSGVIALHAALVQVIEIVRARGESVIEPESYERILREPLDRLQGEDRNANPVSGMNFWKAGPEGAAGTYSSNAARRVLVAKIQALLPKIAAV